MDMREWSYDWKTPSNQDKLTVNYSEYPLLNSGLNRTSADFCRCWQAAFSCVDMPLHVKKGQTLVESGKFTPYRPSFYNILFSAWFDIASNCCNISAPDHQQSSPLVTWWSLQYQMCEDQKSQTVDWWKEMLTKLEKHMKTLVAVHWKSPASEQKGNMWVEFENNLCYILQQKSGNQCIHLC